MQIQSSDSKIIIDSSIHEPVEEALTQIAPHKIFILADNNTYEYCLPKVNKLKNKKNVYVKVTRQGENAKTIDTVVEIWNFLQKNNCDRNDLLINLGGGMILDIGGFAASTFKRGIRYINIPTTLLSMVDASVGGKVGFNFNDYKNHIGLFSQPSYVIINSVFLSTLKQRHIYSGWAEMIKHGLIHSQVHLEQLLSCKPEETDKSKMNELISASVQIKNHFVLQDPFEQNIRKALNFGHTIGHALESHAFKKRTLLHGEAVAAGMACELFLSRRLKNFPENTEQDIQEYLTEKYSGIRIEKEDQEDIINYMKHDKKNKEGKINFVLLENTGVYVIDQFVELEQIIESLEYYNSLVS
ncbi:MAG: 3-dehydroquinate synthase [Bacteroidales bacterium]